MSISVVIVAKNEAHDIAACLESAAWAEERLVVDTGSTDATPELAAAAGARVLQHEWLGYAATKDWAFGQVEGEWVLSLDADERVSEALAVELRRLAAGAPEQAAFELPRRFHFLGRWLKHGGCYPDYQLRFFRRGRARYRAELIHERLRVDGAIGRCRGHLEHYSYAGLSEYLMKLNEYSALWAEQAHAQGRRCRWRHSFSLLSAFGERYLLRGGFLDGRAGLTWALLAGLHSYFKYAKLAELSRRRAG
jgi:glycosyltransferase involved in cell wall biosynthesis